MLIWTAEVGGHPGLNPPRWGLVACCRGFLLTFQGCPSQYQRQFQKQSCTQSNVGLIWIILNWILVGSAPWRGRSTHRNVSRNIVDLGAKTTQNFGQIPVQWMASISGIRYGMSNGCVTLWTKSNEHQITLRVGETKALFSWYGWLLRHLLYMYIGSQSRLYVIETIRSAHVDKVHINFHASWVCG